MGEPPGERSTIHPAAINAQRYFDLTAIMMIIVINHHYLTLSPSMGGANHYGGGESSGGRSQLGELLLDASC